MELKNRILFHRAEAEGVPSGERPTGEDESHGKITTSILHNKLRNINKSSLFQTMKYLREQLFIDIILF